MTCPSSVVEPIEGASEEGLGGSETSSIILKLIRARLFVCWLPSVQAAWTINKGVIVWATQT